MVQTQGGVGPTTETEFKKKRKMWKKITEKKYIKKQKKSGKQEITENWEK